MGLELVFSAGKLLGWIAIAVGATIVVVLMVVMGVLFCAAMAGAWSAREMDEAKPEPAASGEVARGVGQVSGAPKNASTREKNAVKSGLVSD